MFLKPELLTGLLRFRVDAIGFVILAGVGCILCWRALRGRGILAEVPAATRWVLLGLALLGMLTAEWMGARQREALGIAVSSLAPTYVHELQRLGHSKVSTISTGDGVALTELQAAARNWSRLNPALGRFFTFRLDEEDRIRIVVDADAGGAAGDVYPEAPPSFRRALNGEAGFDSIPGRDAFGVWVWSLTPLRDASGRVEAALALGYPAVAGLGSIALTRLVALAAAGFIIALVLAGTIVVARMRSEIGKRADTERALQDAKVTVDEANRAKSDFLAVMSHEIRTPLNAVMGFANLLSGTRLDDAQRGYVSTITTEGARLSSLVDDILDLSKIEEGRLMLNLMPFAPVETAHDVLRFLIPRAMEKRIDLRFEAQIAGALVVSGDPMRFRQVLANLIDNAIKFTPAGSVTLFLTWMAPPEGATQGRLRVRVRDTGIGIPPGKLKTLFQIFTQADSSTSRRYGGTGLGLAICQRLVGLMGGTISVHSTSGEGSEFAFELPLTPATLPPAPAPAEPERVAEPGATPPRILVVDDMETNRFLLEIFLRRNGFEAELASGGEEAVKLATSRRYDAILMDLQMPDVDGYTAVRRIRELEPPGQRTPIIALTASIGPGVREKCLEAGMDDYFTKPLDLAKFRTLLSTLLARETRNR